jgi:predicted N-acyltransferase
MHTYFARSTAEISPAQWNALADPDYPFLSHAFLSALETSGSVGAGSGWQPHHLVARDGSRLRAILPCYLKTHSYGEYVFDWSWADAYRRHGLAYYPKLLSAVPFTPATGPRLLACDDDAAESMIPDLVSTLRAELDRLGASSWHVLFPSPRLTSALERNGLAIRSGVQFHWRNHGYRDFSDFLDGLVSRKRKSIRRERREVGNQGLEISVVPGPEIGSDLWDRFYVFYQMTYARRSGHGGYLERDFFHLLGDTMPEHLMMVVARHRGRTVAGALNFVGGNTLFGRYWGCTEEFANLHFEVCYYRGIEYCIANGLERFDAGAQGEHKLARGFEPVITHSAHLIMEPRFRAAIEDFLAREREAILRYRDETAAELPYRRDAVGPGR